MSKGSVFIVSGASGSGKDTLLVKLFERHPEIKFSISSITRKMRQGEKEGQKYHFISREEFEKMIEEDRLLEHNIYVENYYGTPKEPVVEAVNSGFDIIIEVDVNGAGQIRSKMPEAVSIFIMPPSLEELKKRLSGRGTESPEIVEERMQAAFGEIKRASEYDFIVVNDDIDIAVDDMLSIIMSQRLKTDRQKHLINEVLKEC